MPRLFLSPEAVQSAIINGMTTLSKIETRIRTDSGNVNHQSINIETSHNAYMDFGETPGRIADSSIKRAMLGNAALAMAADIRTVMQTQTLTVSEKAQLMGVLTEMVGSAELAQAYVGQVMAGADAGTRAALEGLLGEIDNGRLTGDNISKRTEGRNAYTSSLENVMHAVGSASQAQSVLDGINPKYFNSDSRFGGGFYVGGDSVTIVAELQEHGNVARYAISYDMNLNGQKVLDLTDPKIALAWDFTSGLTSTNACQEIAETAQIQGYNVIKFESYRGGGINYVVYSNFEEILIPRIVTPID